MIQATNELERKFFTTKMDPDKVTQIQFIVTDETEVLCLEIPV